MTGASHECESQLELGITLAIFLWPSLTLAVNSNWGGPESRAKREWFASATIDLVTENPDADAEWIEEFLLNVMMDEFEVNVEDDSALDVAETIIRLRKDCMQGVWTEVQQMKEKWEAKNYGELDEVSGFLLCKGDAEGVDSSGSVTDSEATEEDEINTHEGALLSSVKTGKMSEVDADGFTVVSKKKK